MRGKNLPIVFRLLIIDKKGIRYILKLPSQSHKSRLNSRTFTLSLLRKISFFSASTVPLSKGRSSQILSMKEEIGAVKGLSTVFRRFKALLVQNERVKLIALLFLSAMDCRQVAIVLLVISSCWTLVYIFYLLNKN